MTDEYLPQYHLSIVTRLFLRSALPLRNFLTNNRHASSVKLVNLRPAIGNLRNGASRWLRGKRFHDVFMYALEILKILSRDLQMFSRNVWSIPRPTSLKNQFLFSVLIVYSCFLQHDGILFRPSHLVSNRCTNSNAILCSICIFSFENSKKSRKSYGSISSRCCFGSDMHQWHSWISDK